MLYGAWYAGAVVVPINAKLHPREVAWIMGDAEVALTFASADLAAPLQAHVHAQTGVGRVIDLAGTEFAELFEFEADPDIAVRAADSASVGRK